MLDQPVLGPGARLDLLPEAMEDLPEEESEDHYELVPDRTVRTNTVRVDLSRLRSAPCAFQAQEFLCRQLQVQPGDVLRLQWCRRERCLYLKMRDQATAEYLVGAHSGRHCFPSGSYRPRITLTLVDVSTEVVLHDLSELVDLEDVQAAMGKYGVVQAIGAGRWQCDLRYAGINNGKLVVRMVIRRPIPHILWIANEQTLVTYDGQPAPRSSLLAGLGRTIRRCFCIGGGNGGDGGNGGNGGDGGN